MNTPSEEPQEELHKHAHGVNFSDVEREERMRLFLDAYAMSLCNITVACEDAKISRMLVWYWSKEYPDFASEMEEAKLRARDYLREIARKRATQRRHPSARVLVKLMEAHLPEHKRQQTESVEQAQTQLDELLKHCFVIEKRYLSEADEAILLELEYRIEERKAATDQEAR